MNKFTTDQDIFDKFRNQHGIKVDGYLWYEQHVVYMSQNSLFNFLTIAQFQITMLRKSRW